MTLTNLKKILIQLLSKSVCHTASKMRILKRHSALISDINPFKILQI